MVGIDYLRAMLERNGERLQSIAILIKDCFSCVLSLSKLVTDQNVAFIDQLLDLISRAVVNLGIDYAINRIALNRLTSILINVSINQNQSVRSRLSQRAKSGQIPRTTI